MKTAIKHHSVTAIILLIVLAVGAIVFVYSGIYNIGADDPHTKPVFTLLQTLRDRSIHVRARDIQVPDLSDSSLILKGAGQYDAMCTQCHLTPGQQNSELRPGLYPQPPNLAQGGPMDPRDAFWVIKHGIKMSAMPAWGESHDDAALWSLVAFLQKLPDMTPQQYQDIVAKAPPDEEMMSSHSNDASGSNAQNVSPDQHSDHQHAVKPTSPASVSSSTGIPNPGEG